MPHKRNPILSERIAGLARLLRGYAHTALEDQPLWHERDISHSAERVILPDATILLDYMLVRMTGLIEGLVVRTERMRENIERGLGLHASSRVLVALVDAAGSPARRPTRSSSAPPSAPPTSAARCATCSPSTRRSPSALSLDRPRCVLRRRRVPSPRPRGHRPTRQPGGIETHAAR